jgi:hypothetical protein
MRLSMSRAASSFGHFGLEIVYSGAEAKTRRIIDENISSHELKWATQQLLRTPKLIFVLR